MRYGTIDFDERYQKIIKEEIKSFIKILHTFTNLSCRTEQTMPLIGICSPETGAMHKIWHGKKKFSPYGLLIILKNHYLDLVYDALTDLAK